MILPDLTVTDDARSLLVSPGFWYGGVLCLAVWSALYMVLTA